MACQGRHFTDFYFCTEEETCFEGDLYRVRARKSKENKTSQRSIAGLVGILTVSILAGCAHHDYEFAVANNPPPRGEQAPGYFTGGTVVCFPNGQRQEYTNVHWVYMADNVTRTYIDNDTYPDHQFSETVHCVAYGP